MQEAAYQERWGDGHNFAPSDYRLLARIIHDWIGEGFGEADGTWRQAHDLLTWIEARLAAYDAGEQW